MSSINEDLYFFPDDYDDNPEEEDDEDGCGPHHKKRKQVKRACFTCRKAHARCDEERPCRRCIRTGCESTCVDVPRKKRVLKKPLKEEKEMANRPKRGRRKKLNESGEGCESGGESDSQKSFYFDAGTDEVIEGGRVGGKAVPSSMLVPTTTSTSLSSGLDLSSSSSSSSSSLSTSPEQGGLQQPEIDRKPSWRDSLLKSMSFAHPTICDAKEPPSASPHEPEGELLSFDLGKSSDDERCLDEIPPDMVRELSELRSYNSTLQDMIKDVQKFNSYQRKKRRQWELSKLNGGGGGGGSGPSGVLLSPAPNDNLPAWLVNDLSSKHEFALELQSVLSSSSAGASSTQQGGYLSSWQANHGAPLQLPPQLAQLAAQHQTSSPANPSQTGPAPFTTSLPFTEV